MSGTSIDLKSDYCSLSRGPNCLLALRLDAEICGDGQIPLVFCFGVLRAARSKHVLDVLPASMTASQLPCCLEAL